MCGDSRFIIAFFIVLVCKSKSTNQYMTCLHIVVKLFPNNN